MFPFSSRMIPPCLALICLVFCGLVPSLGHAAPAKAPTLRALVSVAGAGQLPSSIRGGLLELAASPDEQSGVLALLAVDGLGRDDLTAFCGAVNSLQVNSPKRWREIVLMGFGHCALHFGDDPALLHAVNRLESLRRGTGDPLLATLLAGRYTARLRRELATSGEVPRAKLDRAVDLWEEIEEMGARLRDDAMVELSSNYVLALQRLQAGTESVLVVAQGEQITGIDRRLWAELARDLGGSAVPDHMAALAWEVVAPSGPTHSQRVRRRKASGTFLTVNGGLMAGLSLAAGGLFASSDYIGPWALGVAAPFTVAGIAQLCVGIPLLSSPPRVRRRRGRPSGAVTFMPVSGPRAPAEVGLRGARSGPG